MEKQLETAVFGGGCFWCTEAVFLNLKGVIAVTSGYSGGQIENPSYKAVSSGKTGHAEVIKIDFDPQEISFRSLLEVFFSTHDPTSLNRQGSDVGEQYRSVIFYIGANQKTEAENFIRYMEKEKIFENPIVTSLQPFVKFYEAEDYHKNYYSQNPNQPYCQIVIKPKLSKLRAKYSSLLKD